MGTLWYGGTFYTMIEENDRIEAVYTEDGKIISTGDLKSLKHTYQDRITEAIDLNGKTIFPGFVDSHLHIVGHGEKIVHLDLSKHTSAEHVLESIKERLETLSPGQWLIGEGWNENQWEVPRVIHRKELDEISDGHPILLTRICRHAIIANTNAINQAKIKSDSPDPQGGKIDRDSSGEMTGYFLDTAQDLVKVAIPVRTQADLKQLIDKSVDDLLQLGLVGGHSEDLAYYGENSFEKTWNAYHESIDGVKRKFRAHLLVHHEVIDDFERHHYSYGDGNAYINFGAMKIFSDGALGGRTAWLNEPYHDDPTNYGIPIHTEENLEALIKRARSLELPVAIHAIGDRAILTVAKLLARNPLKNGRRDRIIHAMVVNQDVIAALKKTNAVLDIQPTFVSSDFPWVLDRIGDERAERAYPWKTFLQENIPCAAGSDAPIEEVNPLLGIQAFVQRRSTLDGKIYFEKQQLSTYEAISLYTKGSAYIIGEEKSRGEIKAGNLADFTVLDQDPFYVHPDQLDQIKAVMTIVDGDIMYQRTE